MVTGHVYVNRADIFELAMWILKRNKVTSVCSNFVTERFAFYENLIN